MSVGGVGIVVVVGLFPPGVRRGSDGKEGGDVVVGTAVLWFLVRDDFGLVGFWAGEVTLLAFAFAAIVNVIVP